MEETKPQSALEIINRLKSYLKIRTDIQLSEFLNVRPNTISTWKKRDSVDYNSIIKICELYEIDLNEIFLNRKKKADFTRETPLVSREVQFQYAAGTDKEALLDILPKYQFPFVCHDNSIAFQVVGNNMFPVIEENSYVICEEMDFESIVDNTAVVVVSQQKGLFINRIHHVRNAADTFLLTNENEFYKDLTIRRSEITEIWKICGVLSYDLHNDSKFKFLNDGLRKINTFFEEKNSSKL